MIVQANTDGALALPITEEQRIVELSPGYNQIDDLDWSKVRKHALSRIKNGVIVEMVKRCAKKDIPEDVPEALILPDEKDTDKLNIPAALSDIDNRGNRVTNVIQGTYHLPTLEGWLNSESRSDVRATIMQQINGVKDGTIKG